MDAVINRPSHKLLRSFCFFVANALWLFILNAYLRFWHDWQGIHQWLDGKDDPHLPIQLAVISALIALSIAWGWRARTLNADAQIYSRISAYIVRAAFWSIFLVGLADMMISMLRVEGFLPHLVGDELARDLGRPSFRGVYVHFPLIFLALFVAYFTRGFVMAWLAVLVVIAEFQIVITRFVFSYEQAYMGDLVRFWYAGLFLFASAYTLVNEGHVRVDVLYSNFRDTTKARANYFGALFLGIPLCWVILGQGMASKGAALISPIASFEISQSGFGMYVKYLMSTYLIIFALTMCLQFLVFMLRSRAVIANEPLDDDPQYSAADAALHEEQHDPALEV